jgi:hypothetical protein
LTEHREEIGNTYLMYGCTDFVYHMGMFVRNCPPLMPVSRSPRRIEIMHLTIGYLLSGRHRLSFKAGRTLAGQETSVASMSRAASQFLGLAAATDSLSKRLE